MRTLTILLFALILSSCCEDLHLTEEDIFWAQAYSENDTKIFVSNFGDLDTLVIKKIIHDIPKGDCNFAVSSYDKEAIKIVYEIKKDNFDLHSSWLIHLTAAQENKKVIPIVRFLNMEYNKFEGDLWKEDITFPSGETHNVYLFNEYNCGMNYNQNFQLINFTWHKKLGLYSYENNKGEIWTLKEEN